MNRRREIWPALSLAGALLAVLLLALSVGSTTIPMTEIVPRLARGLAGGGSDAADRILAHVRLPRALAAMGVGCALALAGLAAQVLFRNPLASPSVIGISNGAAVGAVAAMLLAPLLGCAIGAATLLGSIAAGLLAMLAVFAMGRRALHFGPAMLLAGIAIGALCSSLSTAALYLAGERLQAIVFWLMGGLWQTDWRSVAIVAPVSLAGWVLLHRWARELNVSLLGDRAARDLGLDLRRLQRRLLVLTALLTATAVSVSGVIGFVGLVVPHALRLLVGSDHRRLVAPVALGGALLLLVADLAARTLAAPAEIPVGIFTSALGAPIFLWLLDRHRREWMP